MNMPRLHYDCHCYEADPNCPIHGETKPLGILTCRQFRIRCTVANCHSESTVFVDFGERRITLADGWRRDENTGFVFCPEHASNRIVYQDGDSVITEASPTYHNCALCGTGPMNVSVAHDGKSYCWNCIGKVRR